MHAPAPLHSTRHPVATRMAGLAALLTLLAACGERTPTALLPQPQLAEPPEAAYRQFADPAMAALDRSCDTALALAQALDSWVIAVDGAGLQSRFARERINARHRATAIRVRCPADPATTTTTATAIAPQRRAAPTSDSARNADIRPAITADTLDAYARGLDEEVALMRANNTHFVSLSKYGEEGRQVAAKAGLPLPEYRAVRQAMHKVFYELMMHGRYAGTAGQARLAGLEPHKREHAREVLARDPYASLSAAERDAVQARLDALQSQYDRYMDLAAVGD